VSEEEQAKRAQIMRIMRDQSISAVDRQARIQAIRKFIMFSCYCVYTLLIYIVVCIMHDQSISAVDRQARIQAIRKSICIRVCMCTRYWYTSLCV
jgi:hypothetical protein